MKCWALVDRFAKVLKSSNNASPYFDELIRTRNVEWVVKAFLNGGNNPDDENSSVLQPGDFLVTLKDEGQLRPQLNPFQRLAATVDCFTWVFFSRVYFSRTNNKVGRVGKFWENIGNLFGEICVVFWW